MIRSYYVLSAAEDIIRTAYYILGSVSHSILAILICYYVMKLIFAVLYVSLNDGSYTVL